MPYFLIKISVFLTLLAISGCFFNQEVQRWQLATQGATSFSLSQNGRFALLSSNPEGIILWDLFENKQLANFGHQDTNKSSIIFSNISNNNRFAITATSKNFAIWDLAWGEAQGFWSISDTSIKSVAISNSGTKVVLALSNKKALFIDLKTGRRLEFLAHQEKVNDVAISPNGRFVLSGADDKNAYLWNTESGQIIYHFAHKNRVNRVALHDEGKYAFTGDLSGMGKIWLLETGKQLSHLKSFHRYSNFSSARFSENGEYIVTGTPSRRVEYWHTQTGKRLDSWLAAPQSDVHPPSAIVYDVAIDLSGRIISSSSAGIAQAWKIKEGL